jgi:hypothetical protein
MKNRVVMKTFIHLKILSFYLANNTLNFFHLTPYLTMFNHNFLKKQPIIYTYKKVLRAIL